jgi:hypothetical protein
MKYPLSDAQKKRGASVFLREGIDRFEEEDYQLARVFLGLAFNIYTSLEDIWNAQITWPWYETACEKVGIAP